MDGLDGRIGNASLEVAVVVLCPDDHDGELLDERRPLLRIQAQSAESLDGSLKVGLTVDLEVAPAIVAALPRLEHEGESKLGGSVLERGEGVGSRLDG